MIDFIKDVIIVGGDFGNKPKRSSIIDKFSLLLDCQVINGGSFEDIKNLDLSSYKVIFWMPNINNELDKFYPKKGTGSILICSKVLNENRTEIDAISRIFQLHGNAVIAIDSSKNPFNFKLLDALGNSWCETTSLGELSGFCKDLIEWTLASIRKSTNKLDTIEFDFNQYVNFVELNKQVADKFEQVKGRYFGNCSTRCALMFPSMKIDATHMIVSKRNVSKKRLTTDDLVLTRILEDGVIEYFGEDKPSVDTPIQISLYRDFPQINYMIHGHSYIEGAVFTDNYFPCGDMREYSELKNHISGDKGVINLKNHGFLIYSDTEENLKEIITNIKFIEREVGFEKIK